jgi:hypothetical protein
MQTSQKTCTPFSAERVDEGSPLVKCLTLFSSLLERRAIVENAIAARYEGCAWCDSTEQQLVDAIITSIRTRP